MKKRLLWLTGLLLTPSLVFATPYFTYYGKGGDFSHPQIAAGGCIDPINVGNSTQCSQLAALYHRSSDGYLLFKGEDWTLLGVGYAVSGQIARPIIGPSANLEPASLNLLDSVAQTLAPNSHFSDDIHAFATSPAGNISGTFGPAWAPPLWRGQRGTLTIFAGASWKF